MCVKQFLIDTKTYFYTGPKFIKVTGKKMFSSFNFSCSCSFVVVAVNFTNDRLFFHSVNGAEDGPSPALSTHDRELVPVLEARVEPRDRTRGL